MVKPSDIVEEERKQFIQARKDANKKYTEISANSNKSGKYLQFTVCDGNNSRLIRKVMQSRLAVGEEMADENCKAMQDSNTNTWEETISSNLFNFKWKPISQGISFESLSRYGFKQLVNHIDGHGSLTTKDQLFINIKLYCERK